MVYIGYAGCEAYDIVLYTGRTLTKLNYRVLIVDISETNSLYNSILHGMDLDSKDGIVNYRDINYTRRTPTNEEYAMFENGVVFVVYGKNYTSGSIALCRELNVIVNTLPNIIGEINDLMNVSTDEEKKINLLIRDIISPDDVKRVSDSITFKYNSEDYLYLDLSDYENAVNCQVNKVIKFSSISKKMERHIVSKIREWFPEISKNNVKKAIITARRGR